jgi:hypothetical protein
MFKLDASPKDALTVATASHKDNKKPDQKPLIPKNNLQQTYVKERNLYLNRSILL